MKKENNRSGSRKMQPEHQVHTIEPFFDADSRILILGSFPSIKSREANFFYGHPQNRFWKVIAAEFNRSELTSIEEKKVLLKENHIAMWDSIASCTIAGSSDSSIRDVVPNDLNRILKVADIQKIFCNGAASYQNYMKYIYPMIGREAIKLPSTSPANAAWKLDRLIEEWKIVQEYAQGKDKKTLQDEHTGTAQEQLAQNGDEKKTHEQKVRKHKLQENQPHEQTLHEHTDAVGHKHHHTNTKAVLNRLSRAIGHLESIKKMVEDGRDCSEVLIQLSAVKAAINNTGKVILKDHIDHCIVDAVEAGDRKALDDLNHAIDHFIK